ncbi:MAG TPA: amino acid permease, partial [Kofleriaceae bacterium]|nr:amino acid permease [Kofleriaceae bacterium]
MSTRGDEGEGGNERALIRGLGPWASASIVVGTIIGTGIFLKTAVMAQVGGSAVWVLAAWAVAAALSLFGALTYAELGAMFPRAGGEYVFLREGY